MKYRIKTFETFINDHRKEKKDHRLKAHLTDMKNDIITDVNNNTDSGYEVPIEMITKDKIDIEDIDGSNSEGMDEIKPKN